MAIVSLAGAAVAGVSCDVDAPEATDETRNFNRPDVQVVGVRVTTSYDANQRPVRSALTEGGEDAVRDVPVSASIAVQFDRLLLPHKVIRQSICIRPSTDTVESIQQCAEPAQPFAEVEYNPVLRTVFYRLPEGAQLDADTRYRVTVFRSEDANEDAGFFGFDGAPLARTFVFDFQTAIDDTTAQAELLPSKEAYCAAKACFEACNITDLACRAACEPQCVEPTCFQEGDLIGGASSPTLFGVCAFGDCHGPGSPLDPMPDPSVIAMGLDLFTLEGIASTAIGKTAHQTQTGEASQRGDQSPERFGRAMPIIDPGNPGNSYLMYKLLVNPLNYRRTTEGLLADPVTGERDDGLALEIDRLRDSVVVGLPMPATGTGLRAIVENDVFTGDLSMQAMLQLNAWIANGAVLSCEDE